MLAHRVICVLIFFALFGEYVIWSLTVEEISEKLSYHSSIYQPQCRADWAQKYIKLHKESLLAPSSAKYLVAVPNLSGLADRVIGIVSSFMLAMLTNRVFQIGPRHPLIPLQSVFNTQHINWLRPADADWIIEPLKYKAKEMNYNSSVLDEQRHYAVNTLDNWKLIDKLLTQNLDGILGEDAQTTYIVINRGLSIRIFGNKHYKEHLENTWQLTPETAFGCIVHLLFQPKPEIFLTIPDLFSSVMQLQESNKKVLLIGIQIRVGDYVFTQDAVEVSSFHAYFDCARQIEEFAMQDGYTEAKWLVVTDSRSLRRGVVAAYGEKVITSLHTHIEHSAKESSVCTQNCTVSSTGFEAAAAEWWILSFSSYHVISQYSGFGRSASMVGFKGRSVYTIPHKMMSKTVTCGKTSVTDFYDLPYEWSGV
ncbi:hypothetical protein EON65_20195 [archaeon]|nr:MAG: hypothetical protein EON65_20195 [archaeon]